MSDSQLWNIIPGAHSLVRVVTVTLFALGYVMCMHYIWRRFAQYTVVVIVTFYWVFGSTTELYKIPVCFPSFSPIFFKMDNDIAPATSQKLITYLTQVTENTNVKNECKIDFSLKLCFTIYFNAFFHFVESWTHVFMVW